MQRLKWIISIDLLHRCAPAYRFHHLKKRRIWSLVINCVFQMFLIYRLYKIENILFLRDIHCLENSNAYFKTRSSVQCKLVQKPIIFFLTFYRGHICKILVSNIFSLNCLPFNRFLIKIWCINVKFYFVIDAWYIYMQFNILVYLIEDW